MALPQHIAKIKKIRLLTLGPSINNILVPTTKGVDFHTGTVLWNRNLQYTHDLQSYPNFKKGKMTKSYSGLQRDDRKPRRGGFPNYFWNSSLVYFCNCYYFQFHSQKSKESLQTEHQHHRKKNNPKILLHPVDQALADLDLTGKLCKGNSTKSRRKNKN